MEKVSIYYSKETDTMDIWFDSPDEEFISEEVGEGFILKKDRQGKIIGVEKLYVMKSLDITHPLPVEIVVA